MAPSDPFACAGNCKFTAIKITRELSEGRPLSPSRSDENNLFLGKLPIWIGLAYKHTTILYSMIAVFLVGDPFKIFNSVVSFYRILVVNGYFLAAAPIFQRWFWKKRKCNERMNEAVIFPAVKPHYYIKITGFGQDSLPDRPWPPLAGSVGTFNAAYNAVIAYFVRQHSAIAKNNPLPFHRGLVPQVVSRSQERRR